MDIVKSIEKLRTEMVEDGIGNGLKNPKVLEKSQKLDILINTYYNIILNDENKSETG